MRPFRFQWVLGVLLAASGVGRAQTATPPAVTNFGTVAVGASTASTAVTFNIATGGTLGTPLVLTQGVQNQDFTLGTGSTCTGAVASSSTCTVYVVFSPKASQQRLGAVELTNSSGGVIGTALLYGLGQGAVVHFTPGIISTVAGNATRGYNGDGTGPATELYTVQFIVPDGSGNMYFADENNNRVRYYNATTNQITTIIGTGNSTPYNDGVAGTSANITPLGMAIDGAGNLYIADIANNRIRKYDPTTKILTTIIGSGTATYSTQSSVTALSANIAPYGVAIDVSGNLYFTEFDNNVVRMWTRSTGIVTPLAGNGTLGYTGEGSPGTSYEINNPAGIAVGLDGNLYFSEFGGERVRKVTLPGDVISTLIGNGTNSSAVVKPNGIKFNAEGDLYLANQGYNVISKIPYTTQALTTIAGNGFPTGYSGDGGSPLSATLWQPNDIALDTTGNLYISDEFNNRLREVSYAPTAIAFGPVAVNSTNTQIVTIENDGNANLVFSSLSITGTYFTKGGTCATSTPVAPGGTCTITITFVPTAAGAQTGTVTIVDNSLTSSTATQTFAISGATPNSPQTVTFNMSNTALTGSTATLNATASSGLAVTYGVQSGPATISGGTVTYTGAGTVVLTAAQAGSSTYVAASTQLTVTVSNGQNVGTTATLTATVTIGKAGTIGSISTYTQGIQNEDYVFISGGSCAIGTAYTVGQTCTVKYQFAPKHPWVRPGGIIVADGSGNILSATFFSYTGNGGQMLIGNGNAVTPKYVQGGSLGLLVNDNGVYSTTGNQMSMDPAGTIYLNNGGSIYEYPVTGGPMLTTCYDIYNYGYDPLFSMANWNDGSLYVSYAGDAYNGSYYGISGVDHLAVGTGGLIGTSCNAQGAIGYPFPTIAAGMSFDSAGNLYGLARAYSSSEPTVIYKGGSTLPMGSQVFGNALANEGLTINPEGDLYFVERQTNIWLISAAQLYLTTQPGGYATASLLQSGSGITTLATDGWGDVFYTSNSSVYELDYKDPPTLSYPFTAPNATSAEQGLTLTNNGNQGLTIASITFSNAAFQNAGDGNCSVGTTLQASQASFCHLNIVFKPTTGASTVAGTVTIVDSQGTSHVVSLSGISAPSVTAVSPTFGYVNTGTPVTITGASFTGASAVMFGSVAATNVTVVNDTSITATSPSSVSSIGTVDVTVINGGQASTISSADQYTYVLHTKTINFTQPTTPVSVGSQATLSASASNGDPVLFSITGGTATLSGNVVTFTTPGTVTITANSVSTSTYGAATPVSVVVAVKQAPNLTWSPQTYYAHTGAQISAAVLNAASTTAGSISYTAALLPSGAPAAISSSSVLGTGNYWITATMNPTDTSTYAPTSLTTPFSVVASEVFVAGSGGGVAPYIPGATIQNAAAAGGGLGTAVDSSGKVWSVDADGAGVSLFLDNGVLSRDLRSLGLSGASTLAVDGASNVWIANGNGTITQLSNAGVVISTVAGSTATAPSALAIDLSGNVWVSNPGANTMDEVVGGAAPAQPISNAVTNGTPGARP